MDSPVSHVCRGFLPGFGMPIPEEKAGGIVREIDLYQENDKCHSFFWENLCANENTVVTLRCKRKRKDRFDR